MYTNFIFLSCVLLEFLLLTSFFSKSSNGCFVLLWHALVLNDTAFYASLLIQFLLMKDFDLIRLQIEVFNVLH
jgi:hypothetical protein